MPPLADHDERRARVAEVAAELIAERGLDGATFREIAVAAGTSTAIVSHYFTDKKDLLRFTYRAAASRARQRLDTQLDMQLDRQPGGDRGTLLGALVALLPIDAPSRRDWRVWFAFWGIAVADAEMAAEQRSHVRSTRTVIAGLVRRLISSGDLPTGVDADEAARDLLAVVMGLAAQAVFDPRDWPASRQRSFIERHIAQLTH